MRTALVLLLALTVTAADARPFLRKPKQGFQVKVGEFAVQPKQAWTNVADFTSRGIPAVNFGPGATRYAHAVDERVEIAALVRAYEALRRVVLG